MWAQSNYEVRTRVLNASTPSLEMLANQTESVGQPLPLNREIGTQRHKNLRGYRFKYLGVYHFKHGGNKRGNGKTH